MTKGSKGFTLIELIVVIAILGILVAIAIPKYIDLTNKARQAADDGYLAGLRSATLMIYASNIAYRTTNSWGYWPSETQVTNQMTQVQTSLQYYSSFSYDSNSGVWTASP